MLFCTIAFLAIGCSGGKDHEKRYENGKMQVEGDLSGDEKDGEWKWYHENGNLEKVADYDDGDLDGNFVSYYENGKIKSEGEYEDVFLFGRSYKIGEWKYYHPNGQLKEIENYDNPFFWDGPYKDGERIEYYKNGEIKSITEYNDPWIWGKPDVDERKQFNNEKLKKDQEKYEDFIHAYLSKHKKEILLTMKAISVENRKKFKSPEIGELKKFIKPIVPIEWGGDISLENLFFYVGNNEANEKYKDGFPTKEEILRKLVTDHPRSAFAILNLSQHFIEDKSLANFVKSITPYFSPENIQIGQLNAYSELPKDKGGVYLQKLNGAIQYVGKTQKSMGFRKRMSDECNGNQNMKPLAAQMLKKHCNSIRTFILTLEDKEIPNAEQRLIKFFGGAYTDGGLLWNAKS